MITFNYINKILSDFSSAHLQINSYFFGDITKNKQNNIEYPLLWGVNQGVEVGYNQTIYTINIYVLDRFQPGFENENDVYNDTALILQDLKAYLQNNQVGQLILDDTISFDKIGDEINSDNVGGWVGSFKIAVPFNDDLCQIPGIGSGLAVDDDIRIVSSNCCSGSGSSTPGGNNGEIQYNNNGAFSGSPLMLFNSDYNRVVLNTTTYLISPDGTHTLGYFDLINNKVFVSIGDVDALDGDTRIDIDGDANKIEIHGANVLLPEIHGANTSFLTINGNGLISYKNPIQIVTTNNLVLSNNVTNVIVNSNAVSATTSIYLPAFPLNGEVHIIRGIGNYPVNVYSNGYTFITSLISSSPIILSGGTAAYFIFSTDLNQYIVNKLNAF